MTRAATARILSASAMLEPPYFWTTIGMRRSVAGGAPGSRSARQLLPAHLAHFVLLHLARYRGRELGYEFHARGDFVIHDLPLAERLHIIARHRLAMLEFHPSHDLLTVVGLGHSDHIGFHDFRVR